MQNLFILITLSIILSLALAGDQATQVNLSSQEKSITPPTGNLPPSIESVSPPLGTLPPSTKAKVTFPPG